MTAPQTRFVDQFTGRLAGRPSKFFQALSEADERITKAALAQADVDDAAETIALLLAENAELKRRSGCWQGLATAVEQSRDEYGAMVDQLICQRDELLVRVDELEAERDAATVELDALKAEMAWGSMP